MKNIFCIRHGLAFHNIKAMEIGSDAYLMEECFDAPLVEKGIQQATVSYTHLRAHETP